MPGGGFVFERTVAVIKAFSYLRCSGMGQVEGDSFPRQRACHQAFALKNGYEIVREFVEEGVSGTKDETQRPSFTEMVGAILDNGVRTILVENLSRLAREYRIQENLLIYLASKGITLISCDTGENITEAMLGDPMKKALIQIQGIFYELDRAMIEKKTRLARERIRASGQRCEGAKPFGELPGEAEYLKFMRASRDSGCTFKYLAELFNDKGIKTRHGKRWHATTVERILKRKAGI